MARTGQRQTGARRSNPRTQGRVGHDGDVASVLARAVREVEAAVQGGRVTAAVRSKFQAVALTLREERARVMADGSDKRRAEQLKRLDGIAVILARIVVGDAGLLALLAEDAGVSDGARSLKRDLLRAAGVDAAPEEGRATEPGVDAAVERRVVPLSVTSRQLANPFLAPDFSASRPVRARARRLAGWELLGPLLSSFERAGGAAPACTRLPAPTAESPPRARS